MSDPVVRLAMCILPLVMGRSGELATPIAVAVFIGLGGGWARLWEPFSVRLFEAKPEGITITSAFSVRLVPWAHVLAIQTRHHLNRIDHATLHYQWAGRIEVATCSAQDGKEQLHRFVHACASRVASRTSITLAGVNDPGVGLRLMRRFVVDLALATLVGLGLGAPQRGFLLGLITATLSTWVATILHPLHTSTLVLKDGLWRSASPEGRPLRTIPRALRLWVRGLAEAAYRA